MLQGEVLGVVIILQPRVQNLDQVILLHASQDMESFKVADMSLLKLPEGDISNDSWAL